MLFLTFSCSEKKRMRLYNVCNKLGITVEQFLAHALNYRDVLRTEAEKPGAWYWDDGEQTSKKDADKTAL